MNLLPIAASNGDLIIGVIAVVIWIATQIAGRKKPGEQNPEQTPGPVANPQDELKKFFEEMEKNLKGEPEAPPPLPKPVQVRPTLAPAKRPPPPIPSQHPERAVTWTKSVEPKPVPVMAMAPVRTAEESARVFLREAKSVRAAAIPTPVFAPSPLIPELRDRVALRKAIVAMEILGKPVALR